MTKPLLPPQAEKHLVILLGPHAVGKMTVGQELAKLTGLRLFHNHMSIELVRLLFHHSEPEWHILNRTIRQTVFELFAHGNFPGLIFTYMCDFDDPGEFEYLGKIMALFASEGALCHVAELTADFEERLARNRSENRLRHKPSKRDLAWSEAEMRKVSASHRLNSRPGEILPFESYIKLDTTHCPPEEAAAIIKSAFSLPDPVAVAT